MIRRFFLILLTVAISLLTGCFGPVAAPTITTYQLQDSAHPTLARQPGRTTLLVTMPTTNSTYQSKNMLYTLDRYQTQPFVKHQWIAPPTQMLFPLLINSLRSTNYFHAVIPAASSGKANYLLTTQLSQFQQYFFSDTENSYFKMSLLAILTNNKTHKIIAEKRFDATVNASERTPYGGVIAANQATASVLNQLARWTVLQISN